MNTGTHVSLITSLLTGLLLLIFNSTLFAHGELNILIAATEKAPVLDNIESVDLLYTKGAGRVIITGTITIADTDSKELSSATIRITSGFYASEDILRFSRQHNISGYWNQANGILYLNGKIINCKLPAGVKEYTI